MIRVKSFGILGLLGIWTSFLFSGRSSFCEEILVGIFCNESLEGLVKAMVIINSNTAQLNEFPFCLFHRHTARITAGMTMKLTNETSEFCQRREKTLQFVTFT